MKLNHCDAMLLMTEQTILLYYFLLEIEFLQMTIICSSFRYIYDVKNGFVMSIWNLDQKTSVFVITSYFTSLVMVVMVFDYVQLPNMYFTIMWGVVNSNLFLFVIFFHVNHVIQTFLKIPVVQRSSYHKDP